MAELMAGATDTDLGGKKFSQSLRAKIRRAQALVVDPTTTKKLKHAANQLKSFSKKLNKGLARGKVRADLGGELSGLATEASDELAGLITPPG
jgi:hypothetical protein